MTGEEFGVLACLVIAAIFAFIVLRGLFLAARNEDPFCRFAAAGLVMLFGLQSCINMAVNRASHAGQGHDLALYLLRRLVAHLAVARASDFCSRSCASGRGPG